MVVPPAKLGFGGKIISSLGATPDIRILAGIRPGTNFTLG
jgi:hypothetical protein